MEGATRSGLVLEAEHLDIRTFHSFFWEMLRTYGYLLGSPRRLSILSPQDERAMNRGISHSDPGWGEWVARREELFVVEGRVAFDLFAPKVHELLHRGSRLCRAVADKYPLMIVDEAQDTGTYQWSCISLLAAQAQVLCLADLDQQIYDFVPGVGPERISQIEHDLRPTVVDLGGVNNRSPNREILAFGNDILSQKPRTREYQGVSIFRYRPNARMRDLAIRRSVGAIGRLIEGATGTGPDSIAILASFDRGVAVISNALRAYEPIPHRVLFDEATTCCRRNTIDPGSPEMN
jgi:DNA helicase-2/ATP-dependent DNA helicase PcrA